MLDYRISVVGARAACADGQLRRQWQQALVRHGGLAQVQQGPEWVEHLLASGYPAPLHVALVQGPGGRLEAAVPLRLGSMPLHFQAAQLQLARVTLEGAAVLGGPPALPDVPGLLQHLVAELLTQLPGCDVLQLRDVATAGRAWHELTAAAAAGGVRFYAPDRPMPRRSIDLPQSLDGYLARFGSRKRGKLRRRIRTLRKQLGELRLQRIERPEQVDAFLDTLTELITRSWKRSSPEGAPLRAVQGEGERLREAARRGLLRSYVLECGGRPCACVLGYQYGDVFLYAEIAYDEAYARYSPGTVLFLLLVEDLCRVRPARRLDFGPTDNLFKQEFANRADEEASVLLLRDGWRNRVLQATHSGFRGSVEGAKGLLQRVGVMAKQLEGNHGQ